MMAPAYKPIKEAKMIDRYTKAVLTVIALCLLYLCMGRPGMVTAAAAQTSGYPRMVLQGWVDSTGVEWKFPQPKVAVNGVAALPAEPPR
jgi:hypothetical protein